MAIMRVVNDTIIADGVPFADYSPRDIGVRNAMFLLTLVAPIVASLLCFFSTPEWASRKNLFTFSKISALWFLSIWAVGVSLYYEPGVTPRLVFIIAGMHGQVEVMMNMLFLGYTGKQALAATWAWSLFQYGCTLTIKSPIVLFSVAAIIGGTNDFLMFECLMYGKQYGLAMGAASHLLSAVTVFFGIVDNFGVVPWNFLSFVGLWGHIFFIVAGILNAPRQPLLPDSHHEDVVVVKYDEPPANPLYYVNWTPKVITTMIGIGLVNSTVITMYLAFIRTD